MASSGTSTSSLSRTYDSSPTSSPSSGPPTSPTLSPRLPDTGSSSKSTQ
eukprot:CAMPEP_0172556310 /NCGR_PEP_ID=MMETSP1067-20121228/65327_1 /TAXON_ID=265564 ORGANISM="Thalassiosira punctigera, Strain Tpunct2005C2" /NCGR_SAMPLE_ID=MMETSP1067 /ASSEMBLY_ACC=CAM_ASM_000444 /LENGTH=48 /DNA_ID=CAMNT_0013345089 /DNA_START=30 /DNA_END=179 /DNA_ORIENTATION=+